MNLYKIGDICDLLNITPRTIRYYDQLGLLPNIKRSDGYTRLFDQNDIDTIKSIRHLQKSKVLPLNLIKETLFPNNLNQQNVLLLTDSFSQKSLPLSSQLTIIPFDETLNTSQQSKQINDFIHNIEIKPTLIICFFHESLTKSYAAISKNLPKNTYFLYPLKHYGMTNYMITDYIANHIHTFSNLTELHLVINRFITLGFSLCLLDCLDTYITIKDTIKHPHNFVKPITKFFPILLSNNETELVMDFKADFSKSIEEIVLTIDILLQKQKRYIQEACIFYSHSNVLANAIKNELNSICPNFTCSIQKINDWSYPKNKVNFISII